MPDTIVTTRRSAAYRMNDRLLLQRDDAAVEVFNIAGVILSDRGEMKVLPDGSLDSCLHVPKPLAHTRLDGAAKLIAFNCLCPWYHVIPLAWPASASI